MVTLELGRDDGDQVVDCGKKRKQVASHNHLAIYSVYWVWPIDKINKSSQEVFFGETPSVSEWPPRLESDVVTSGPFILNMDMHSVVRLQHKQAVCLGASECGFTRRSITEIIMWTSRFCHNDTAGGGELWTFLSQLKIRPSAVPLLAFRMGNLRSGRSSSSSSCRKTIEVSYSPKNVAKV